MIEMFMMLTWIVGIVLGVMWVFLPWIMISKLDQVIDELKRINSGNTG